MSVAMHLCVCLYICRGMKEKLDLYETPMYFSYFVYLSHIMLYYAVWGHSALVLILVTKFQLLTKICQNHFFIYFDGFKYLVYYNLVVCYSLDPVLVIWCVSLVIFFFCKFNCISLN